MQRLLVKTEKGYDSVKPIRTLSERAGFLYKLGNFAGQVEDLMEKYHIDSIEELEARIKND